MSLGLLKALTTVVALIPIGVSTQPTTITIESAKALARTQMVQSLRDPESARFRGVTYSRQSDGRVIFCGEINARNGMGGYTGFVRFVTSVTTDRAVNVEIAEQRNLSSRMLVSAVWSTVCQEGVRPIDF